MIKEGRNEWYEMSNLPVKWGPGKYEPKDSTHLLTFGNYHKQNSVGRVREGIGERRDNDGSLGTTP